MPHKIASFELEKEMTLVKEQMRQYADLPCMVSDAAAMDKRDFVERTDQVWHRVWIHSTSL